MNMKATLQSPGQTLESKLKSILRSSPFTSFKELESISPSSPKKSNNEAQPVQDASDSLHEDQLPNPTTGTANTNQQTTYVEEAQRVNEINNTPPSKESSDPVNQTVDGDNHDHDQEHEQPTTAQNLAQEDPEHSFSPLDKNGQRCSQILMNMFKMEGLAKPETRVHPNCPNVKVSCCTEADDKRSLELWNSSLKPLIEVRYESVINSL